MSYTCDFCAKESDNDIHWAKVFRTVRVNIPVTTGNKEWEALSKSRSELKHLLRDTVLNYCPECLKEHTKEIANE